MTPIEFCDKCGRVYEEQIIYFPMINIVGKTVCKGCYNMVEKKIKPDPSDYYGVSWCIHIWEGLQKMGYE